MRMTSIGRNVVVAVGIAAATYVVVTGGTFLEGWHAWSRVHPALAADQIPAALLAALAGLGWFAFGRWRGHARAHADRPKDGAWCRRLVDALETLPVGIALYDDRGQIAFCNGRYRRLAPGGAVKPDGRPGAECLVAGADLLIHQHRVPDGGTLVVIEDVTERKATEAALRESEARLRAILDNSPASIHLKDRQGRLLVVNKEFERRNRVAAKDALGHSSFDLIPEESADRLRAEESWVIENRMPRSFERPLKYADGETGTYLAVKFPIIDAAGTLTGIGSISTDVTAHRRVEEQARRLREDLAQVGRFHAMGELAAGFAHEVNQPLAAISAYATGILKRLRSGEGTPAELIAIMERLSEQARRAGTIVWRIYRFVRKPPSDKRSVDVNLAIAAAIGTVEARAVAGGVTIDQHLATDLPPVLADAVQIQQVVINLLGNAIEAMGEGQAERRLTVTTRRVGEATVEVEVADTGRGMTPEDRDRLFQPFFTTKADGMGIGLLVCQTIVEEHGGTLEVATEPGRGTAVTFSLPAVVPGPSA